MKKIFLALTFLLTFSFSFAQRGEKIESLKVGFLTNKLSLDAGTAEKFWPVYHLYENELMTVVQEQRRMNQNESRSADDILDQEQKALDIKRKYSSVFSKIISQGQLNQLYQAERDFRQMIINRSQKREARIGQDRPDRSNIDRVQNRQDNLQARPMRDNNNMRQNAPSNAPSNTQKPSRFGR